jgi:lysine decarboxylase
VIDHDAGLLDAWTRFVAAPGAPFTIPGHKHRAAEIWPELGRLLAGDVPLFGGLASVKTAVAEVGAAEERGAHLWGGDWCRYSTGGSTHTNQAVALAVGHPGDEVIVTRTAHRSTLLGLILAGLSPVWLRPSADERSGMPLGVEASTVAEALAEHPDAVAVFLVEPSYVGTMSDVAAIADVAHRYGVPVVVDQAWGAHLGFHPAYPRHALAAGADVMILSAHKTLPAYSQASVVAAHTQRLDRARLERGFEATATTSPAGAILASIDAARALLSSSFGVHLLDDLLRNVEDARAEIGRLDDVVVPGPADFPTGRFDPAKLVINLAASTLSGNDIEAGLIARGHPVEMADRETVIPIVTMTDDGGSVRGLCTAIAESVADAPRIRPRPGTTTAVWQAAIPPAVLPPRDAFFAAHESVAADEARGRIAAEVIAPYPPGIPIVVPGELITSSALGTLRAAAAAGTRIAYAADPTLLSIQVVR